MIQPAVDQKSVAQRFPTAQGSKSKPRVPPKLSS